MSHDIQQSVFTAPDHRSTKAGSSESSFHPWVDRMVESTAPANRRDGSKDSKTLIDGFFNPETLGCLPYIVHGQRCLSGHQFVFDSLDDFATPRLFISHQVPGQTEYAVARDRRRFHYHRPDNQGRRRIPWTLSCCLSGMAIFFGLHLLLLFSCWPWNAELWLMFHLNMAVSAAVLALVCRRLSHPLVMLLIGMAVGTSFRRSSRENDGEILASSTIGKVVRSEEVVE